MTQMRPFSPHPTPSDTTGMIRRATPKDVPACTRIVADWVAAHIRIPVAISNAEIERRIIGAIQHRLVLVYGRPGQKVTAFLSLDTEHSEIRGLFSAQPGSGHGKALLDHVKQGRTFLAFHAPLLSPPVQTYFRAQGFVPVGTHAQMPDYPVTGLRMEWWRET